MRYDVELTVNLKEDAPEGILQVLGFLMSDGEGERPEVPEDPLFDSGWLDDTFATWATGCEPVAGEAICSFRRVYRYTRQSVEHFQYTLHLRFSSKLEPIFEIFLPFAMWLAKWSDQDECVGSYKGEGTRHPSLLYFHDGKLYHSDVSEPPECTTDGTLWN